MGIERIIFSATAGALIWTWGGYHAFLALIARGQPPLGVRDVPDAELPSVAVVVVAHNEERTIAAKIENSLALDWPADRLELIVASDGSTDRTDEIAAGYPVRLVRRPRCGKALMSNVGAAATSAEWLLFTDAETRLEQDVLRRMAVHFSDPGVGMVDAALLSANADASAIAGDVGLYWRLESALKTTESRCGCLSSTFGACSAVRRSVFEALEPTEDIDFRTPLDAVARGFRVVHEPAARAFDVGHSDIASQYRARARMVTKNLPGTLRNMDGRIMRRPLIVVGIVSHKLLRWLTPFLVLGNLLAALRMAKQPLGKTALLAHGSTGVAGAAGWLAYRRGRELPAASSVFSFIVANAGFAAGVINSVRRVQITSYQPSQELAPPAEERAPARPVA